MSAEEATTREMIRETRRDVAWIRETLAEIKKTNDAQDDRITALEQDRSRVRGRDGVIYLAAAAFVSFLTSIFSGGGIH